MKTLFDITDKASFRNGYKFLSILENPDFRAQHHYKDVLDEYTANVKRELRAWAHKETAVDVGLGFKVERRVVKDNGIDGFVELVSIPNVFNTVELAEDFFRDFLELNCRPSQYDCTGQAFTSWHKLFKRNGAFYVYHSVAFDV